jgi:hypothetical protein
LGLGSREILAEWLARMGEHFGKDITAANAGIYAEGLSDLSGEQIDAACREAMKSCEFMPTVAAIRKYVKRVAALEQSSESDHEWALVQEQIIFWDEGYQKWGMSGPPKLSEAGWYAMRNCGGPSAIQRTKPEHLPLLKKTWDEAYSRQREQVQLGLTDGQSRKLLAQIGEISKVKSIQ